MNFIIYVFLFHQNMFQISVIFQIQHIFMEIYLFNEIYFFVSLKIDWKNYWSKFIFDANFQKFLLILYTYIIN